MKIKRTCNGINLCPTTPAIPLTPGQIVMRDCLRPSQKLKLESGLYWAELVLLHLSGEFFGLHGPLTLTPSDSLRLDEEASVDQASISLH